MEDAAALRWPWMLNGWRMSNMRRKRNMRSLAATDEDQLAQMESSEQDCKARYHNGGGSPDAGLPSWVREDGSDEGHEGTVEQRGKGNGRRPVQRAEEEAMLRESKRRPRWLKAWRSPAYESGPGCPVSAGGASQRTMRKAEEPRMRGCQGVRQRRGRRRHPSRKKRSLPPRKERKEGRGRITSRDG